MSDITTALWLAGMSISSLGVLRLLPQEEHLCLAGCMKLYLVTGTLGTIRFAWGDFGVSQRPLFELFWIISFIVGYPLIAYHYTALSEKEDVRKAALAHLVIPVMTILQLTRIQQWQVSLLQTSHTLSLMWHIFMCIHESKSPTELFIPIIYVFTNSVFNPVSMLAGTPLNLWSLLITVANWCIKITLERD